MRASPVAAPLGVRPTKPRPLGGAWGSGGSVASASPPPPPLPSAFMSHMSLARPRSASPSQVPAAPHGPGAPDPGPLPLRLRSASPHPASPRHAAAAPSPSGFSCLAAAPSQSVGHANANANATTNGGDSLLDVLGGPDALKAVLEDTMTRMTTDPRVAHFFVGMSPQMHIKKQRAFLEGVLGGKEVYSGRSMFKAHAHLQLSEADFDAFCQHTLGALRDADVGEEVVGQVQRALLGLRDPVLGREGWSP